MDFGLIFSVVLVTGGAGVVGVALSQLMRGRVTGRAFASDVLLGAGICIAGAAFKTPASAGMAATAAGMALMMSGTILRMRNRAQDATSRELPPTEKRQDNSLDRRS